MRNFISSGKPLAKSIDALNSGVQIVDSALNTALNLSSGLLIQRKTFGILRGPSGGPELLALIYADDPVFGYWYGHALRHPRRKKIFVAVIVRSNKLVEASSVPLLFARFHYWMTGRLQYEPCYSQRNGDVYDEADSLNSAASRLACMIQEFKLEERSELAESHFEGSHVDSRVLEVYGMEGDFDEDGGWGPPPMPTPLAIV